MALLRSIATVGGYTMASRVLGFVRDMMIAGTVGAGPVADAFFVAFKLPNFFRRLSAEGAFTAAFVPMVSGRFAVDGREAAVAFAERTLSVMLFVLLGFLIVMELAMPVAMYAFAPGFADRPETFALAVELTRITFPYLIFVSLVALLGGVLNALDRFAAMAAAPILLNVVLIGALLYLVPWVPTAGHALAIGVTVSGVAQLLALTIALRRAGIRIRLPRPRLTPGIRRLFRLMLPAALGAGVVQVNMVVDVVLASLLPAGAVSYLYYADRVNQLPLGVVGVAVGTALLPLLSRKVRSGDTAGASDSQNRALEFSLLLTLPAAIGLAIIADPMIATLFERGAFTAEAAAATSATLSAFALGLPAFVLVKVLTPGFFARADTGTPVKIAVGAMIANLVFNLALMPLIAHVGIALATSLAAWLNAGALALILRRRGHLVLDARFRCRMPRIALACATMAVPLWVGVHFLPRPLPVDAPVRAGLLFALIGGAILIFAVVSQLSGAARLGEMRRAFARRGNADGDVVTPV